MPQTFDELRATWTQLGEPARAALTNAVVVEANAAISKADQFWPATYGDRPTVEMLGVVTDSASVRRAHFIAHALNYNHAQSGSDWANHYVMVGDIALGDGDAPGAVRLRMVVASNIREYDWETYRSRRVVEEERNKAIADLGATPPAPEMKIITIVRCPWCGATDAGAIEHIFEIARMHCGRCGNWSLSDDEQIKDEWNVKHERRKDESSLPTWVPPLPSTEPGFETRGELLEHRGRGYSIAIPDARWEGPQGAQSALLVADVWAHVVVRADTVFSRASLDETVRKELQQAAERRATKGGTFELLPAPVPPGADASMYVTYPRVIEDEGDITELLALTLKAKKPESYDAMFVYAWFPPKHVDRFAWANLRAALLASQRWVSGQYATTPLWPVSGVYTEPKQSLGYTKLGSDRASIMAEQLGAMTAEQAQRASAVLEDEASSLAPPTAAWRASDTERVTQKMIDAVGPELGRLLVEHLGEVASLHDFRGWCRGCAWAVDNRGRKRGR